MQLRKHERIPSSKFEPKNIMDENQVHSMITRSRSSLSANKSSSTNQIHSMITRSRSSLSANKSSTMKRKSLSQDHDENKKKKKQKKKKQATTRTKPNIESFTCGICLASVQVSKMFKNTSCDHPFCTKCISTHVKIQRKDKVVKLNCPNADCSVELKPEHFQSILTKQFLVEWETAICESLISLKEKFYCPFNDCSILLVNECAEVATSCECPSCHRLFCAQCKVPWHADMDCTDFQKQLENKVLELAKKNNWQKCPKCLMLVERNGGCNHMSCRCGCNFCYKCGTDYTSTRSHPNPCNVRPV